MRVLLEKGILVKKGPQIIGNVVLINENVSANPKLEFKDKVISLSFILLISCTYSTISVILSLLIVFTIHITTTLIISILSIY